MTFAERLQQLRERAGLSQSQLAKSSGVPVWTLRGYEQGRREPSWDVLFKLAKGLGMTCEAFSDCVSNGTPGRPRKSEAPAAGKRRGKGGRESG